MADRPFVLLGQQYLVDPSRSSGNANPIYAYAHVPHAYDGDATDAVLDQIERFAPGFREQVLAISVRGPAELEAYNANYVGGDIAAGANTARQIVFRPRPAANPYALGVDGVYLCSSATPPGGGCTAWAASTPPRRRSACSDLTPRLRVTVRQVRSPAGVGAVEFRVLGEVGVAGPQGPLALRRREKDVLARLLVQPNRPVAVATLVDDLWDGQGGSANALRVHISSLRGTIAQAESASSRITSTPHGYVLTAEVNEVDAALFERSLTRAEQLSDPAQAAAALLTAANLWRGAPFPEIHGGQVVEAQTVYLARRYEECVSALGQLHVDLDTGVGVARWQQWLDEFPTNESVAAALAAGLYREGDQVSALDHLRRFRERLADEWGLDATDQLTGCETRLLRQDIGSTRVEVRTEGPPPADREDVVATLLRVLAPDSPMRIAVVTGPAGIGKSTVVAWLAEHLGAAEPARRRSQGFWAFLPVLDSAGAGLWSPPSPRGAVVAGDPHRELARQVGAALRDSGCRVLVVDDADALDPDSVAVLRALLPPPRPTSDSSLLVATLGPCWRCSSWTASCWRPPTSARSSR